MQFLSSGSHLTHSVLDHSGLALPWSSRKWHEGIGVSVGCVIRVETKWIIFLQSGISVSVISCVCCVRESLFMSAVIIYNFKSAYIWILPNIWLVMDTDNIDIDPSVCTRDKVELKLTTSLFNSSYSRQESITKTLLYL